MATIKNIKVKSKNVTVKKRNENSSYYQNDCFLIGSYVNFVVKLIPLDHFYANIDGITSKTEYWKEKLILQSILCGL